MARKFVRNESGHRAFIRSAVVGPIQAEGNGQYEGSWRASVAPVDGHDLFVEISTGRLYAVKAA